MFGWTLFPAFGLLVRGIAGLSEEGSRRSPGGGARERELLEALQRRGELTPAQAAMETSLTVNEADEMLKELAAKAATLTYRCAAAGCFTGCGTTVPGLGSANWARSSRFPWYHAHGIIRDPEWVFGA